MQRSFASPSLAFTPWTISLHINLVTINETCIPNGMIQIHIARSERNRKKMNGKNIVIQCFGYRRMLFAFMTLLVRAKFLLHIPIAHFSQMTSLSVGVHRQIYMIECLVGAGRMNYDRNILRGRMKRVTRQKLNSSHYHAFFIDSMHYSLWRSRRDCITVTISSTNLSITFYYLLENQRIRRALFFEMPFNGKPSNAQLQDTSIAFFCSVSLIRSLREILSRLLFDWILMENWNSYIIITYKIIGIVMYVRASEPRVCVYSGSGTRHHIAASFFSSVIYFIYFSFSFYLQFIGRQHQNRHIPLCARLKANFIYVPRAAHSLPPFQSQCLHIRMHLHMHNLYIINALKNRSEKCIEKKRTKRIFISMQENRIVSCIESNRKKWNQMECNKYHSKYKIVARDFSSICPLLE